MLEKYPPTNATYVHLKNPFNPPYCYLYYNTNRAVFHDFRFQKVISERDNGSYIPEVHGIRRLDGIQQLNENVDILPLGEPNYVYWPVCHESLSSLIHKLHFLLALKRLANPCVCPHLVH